MTVEASGNQVSRGAGISIPPPIIYVGALATGHLVNSFFPWTLLPAGARPTSAVVGWILVAAGTAFATLAAIELRRSRTPITLNRPVKRLVTDGVYRRSRNPMYVSLGLIAIGVVLLWNMTWPLLALIGLFAVMNLWIVRSEERHLAARFGEEYDAYRRRVRRWL
ncbi:MAG: isoprenylcysteine carboxylmethyltransferase family protein [Planctomycetota bacterium]